MREKTDIVVRTNRFSLSEDFLKKADNKYTVMKITCDKGGDYRERNGAPDRLAAKTGMVCSSVYGSKAQNGKYGTYLLVEGGNEYTIRKAFRELYDDKSVRLEPTTYKPSSLNSDSDEGDKNGLCNLFLYALILKAPFSDRESVCNANSSLYYTTRNWLYDDKGNPRYAIKLVRIRFMANQELIFKTETWRRLPEDADIRGKSVISISADGRLCTVSKKMRENMIAYEKHGTGQKAEVSYLDFADSDHMRESINGAAANILSCGAVREAFVQKTYTIPDPGKDVIGINRFAASAKHNAYNDAWHALTGHHKLYICRGSHIADDEWKRAIPAIRQISEILGCEDADPSGTLQGSIQNHPDGIFIPVTRPLLTLEDWNKKMKPLDDDLSIRKIPGSTISALKPLYDEYNLDLPEGYVWEALLPRIQHIAIDTLLPPDELMNLNEQDQKKEEERKKKQEEKEKKRIIPVAEKLRSEILIKNDVSQRHMAVFPVPKTEDEKPYVFAIHGRAVFSRKKGDHNPDDAERTYYAMMKIATDGTCTYAYGVSGDPEMTDELKKIEEMFETAGKYVEDRHEYTTEKQTSELLLYPEGEPEHAVMIGRMPLQLLCADSLPDAVRKKEMPLADKNEIMQEYLAGIWIAAKSQTLAEAAEISSYLSWKREVRKAVSATDPVHGISWDELFSICGVKDMPDTSPRVAGKKKEETDEKKIEQKKEALTPWKFTQNEAEDVIRIAIGFAKGYKEHPEDAEDDICMCIALFGIRQCKYNIGSLKRNSSISRLNKKCGSVLVSTFKSNPEHGIVPFMRPLLIQDDTIFPDRTAYMMYSGQRNIQSTAVGRHFRYLIPVDPAYMIDRNTAENIEMMTQTTMITSDNSYTVIPYPAKYLRTYLDAVIRQYKYRVAQKRYSSLDDKQKHAVDNLAKTEVDDI